RGPTNGVQFRAYAPPGQDAPRRLSLSSAGGRMPPGYGQRHVQLPRLLPYLGQVKEGGERGEASDGQRPVRAGAGGCKRLVPTQSASILARSACPSVPDVARPLCLLRHIGQLSTHTMVRLPGRGAVEEMAGATASRRRRVPLTRLNAILQRHPLPPARIAHRLYANASETLP